MMRAPLWIRVVSHLVPRDRRRDWVEEWAAEVSAMHGRDGRFRGAFADAWFLRTEGLRADAVSREFRITVRTLLRRPAFTGLAGGTLALGIGGVAAAFALVDGVLLDPLPFPESDRLVSANHVGPGLGTDVVPQSEGTYLHYLERTRALESLAIYSDGSVNLVSGPEPRRVPHAAASAGFFDVLRVRPALGRAFQVGDDGPGAVPIVVVSHDLWQRELGSDPTVLGTTLEIDGVTRRVVGVMPETFAFPEDAELWIPLFINPADPVMGNLTHQGIGRLAEGSTVEQADAELHDLIYALFDERPTALAPRSAMERVGFASDVRPLKDTVVGEIRELLWLVLSAIGFLLLMACANVANLVLLRAEAQQPDRAVRMAVGASRRDLARHSLMETLTLSLAAGALAVPLAALGVAWILAASPMAIPRASEVAIDGSVVAFILLVALLVGLVLSWASLRGASTSAIASAVAEGGRARAAGRRTRRIQSSLAIGQVALALLLLAGSGLMGRTFAALRSTDPGFDAGSRLTFRITLPEADYSGEASVRAFQRELWERLAGLPGVGGVAMDTGLPLKGYTDRIPLQPVDQPPADGEFGVVVERRSVTPEYFSTMGIPLRGRDLSWESSGIPQVVVNEALAQQFWPGEQALGRRIRAGSAAPEWEVVGVAGNVSLGAVHEDPVPVVYLPLSAANRDLHAMDVVLRVGGDPTSFVPEVRSVFRALDPRLPLTAPRPLQELVDESLAVTSFVLALLGIAAAVALLLGTIGIYGVVAYLVRGRTREIGVRIALGAPSRSIVRQLVARGVVLTAAGIGLGLVCAWLLARFLGSFLYGVQPMDALTLVGTAVFLAMVALTASWIPARRALRMDANRALRVE